MNEKEFKEWAEYNSPYQYTNDIRNREHPDILRNEGFWEGAKAMAKHFEERQRAENDAAFLLGAEAQKKQPPTDEQITKFLQLYNDYCHISSSMLKQYPTAKEYILKKWNNE